LVFASQVTAFAEPPAVVTPSGVELDLTFLSPTQTFGTWEGAFDSLGDAFEFVSGDWQAAYSDDSQSFPDVVRLTREVTVLPIAVDDVIRSAPKLITPVAGSTLFDETESLFEWSYQAVPAQLNSIGIDVRDSDLGFGRAKSTPSPGSSISGSSGVRLGDQTFGVAYRSEPGASANRWLYTINSSDEHLPVDLDIQLGGVTDLSGFLLVDGDPLSFPRNQSLTYVRQGDLVTVRLVVPEPSVALLAVFAATAAVYRSR